MDNDVDELMIIKKKITLTETELNDIKDTIIDIYRDSDFKEFDLTITYKGDILINKEV